MARYTYPAIFSRQADGGFYIYFPDIENCYTQGEDIADGVAMANDVLPLMLIGYEDQGLCAPAPSDIESLRVGPNDFARLVSCDTALYRSQMQAVAPLAFA